VLRNSSFRAGGPGGSGGTGSPPRSGGARGVVPPGLAQPKLNTGACAPGERASEENQTVPEFSYADLLPLGEDATGYRQLSSDGVTARRSFGRNFLEIEPQVLTGLTAAA